MHEWLQLRELQSERPPLVSTYDLYIDDSGNHEGSRQFILAGYFASTEEWAGLSSEWNSLLDAWGIEHVHMAHLEHGKGSIRAWPIDVRHQRVYQLARLVDRYTRRGVLVAMLRYWYESVLAQMAKTGHPDERHFNHPYYYTLHAVACWVPWHCKLHGIDTSKVRLILSQQPQVGHRGIYNLSLMFEGLGMPPPIFVDMRDCPPVQAADMLAWVCNRTVGRRFKIATRHSPLMRRLSMRLMSLDEVFWWGKHVYANLKLDLLRTERLNQGD